MRLAIVAVSAFFAVSSAKTSHLAERDTDLLSRAEHVPHQFKPCETSTCTQGQFCFVPKKGGDNICTTLEPIGGKCKLDYACIKFNKGLVCHEEKCYKPVPKKKLNEICDLINTCESGLGCRNQKCKKNGGSTCSSASECYPGTPCANGKCSTAKDGEKCKSVTDCADYLYCAKASGTCKAKSRSGGACDEDAACSRTKCYKNKCEAHSYMNDCAQKGDNCPKNLICNVDKKCDYRLPAGAACQYTGECQFGLCHEGTCQELRSDGKKCTNDIDCGQGRLCSRHGNCCARHDSVCSDAH